MKKTTRKQLMNLFMLQVWNEGNFSRLPDMVAPDYSVSQDDYDPWSGQVIDHETFKQRVLYSRNAFPDLNFDIQEMGAGAFNFLINMQDIRHVSHLLTTVIPAVPRLDHLLPTCHRRYKWGIFSSISNRSQCSRSGSLSIF
jgi:hypothetical protein